jgi:hypothetical protein
VYEARSSPLGVCEEKKTARPPSLNSDVSESVLLFTMRVVSLFLAANSDAFWLKWLCLLESGAGEAGRSSFSNVFANSSVEKFILPALPALSLFWAWWDIVTLHVKSGQQDNETETCVSYRDLGETHGGSLCRGGSLPRVNAWPSDSLGPGVASGVSSTLGCGG